MTARDNSGRTALDEALQKHNDSAVQKLSDIYASFGMQKDVIIAREKTYTCEKGLEVRTLKDSDSDLVSRKKARNVCEQTGWNLSQNPDDTSAWIDSENARMGAVFFRLSVS